MKIRHKGILSLLTGCACIFFSADLMAADGREYSEAELLRDQRSLEYSAQEWREIAGLLMGMDFQHPETDVAYMKQLPLDQNMLLRSFLHRWRKTRSRRADYIRQLSGSESEDDPAALKKLFRGKLEQHCADGTVSAVFLSDLADEVAVHKNIYNAEEVDDLLTFFPKIRSNMLKNSFFHILLANGFFSRKELPPQYSKHLDSMLYNMTNRLRERLNLPLLPAR
mgnify:CR=1 FL=1